MHIQNVFHCQCPWRKQIDVSLCWFITSLHSADIALLYFILLLPLWDFQCLQCTHWHIRGPMWCRQPRIECETFFRRTSISSFEVVSDWVGYHPCLLMFRRAQRPFRESPKNWGQKASLTPDTCNPLSSVRISARQCASVRMRRIRDLLETESEEVAQITLLEFYI